MSVLLKNAEALAYDVTKAADLRGVAIGDLFFALKAYIDNAVCMIHKRCLEDGERVLITPRLAETCPQLVRLSSWVDMNPMEGTENFYIAISIYHEIFNKWCGTTMQKRVLTKGPFFMALLEMALEKSSEIYDRKREHGFNWQQLTQQIRPLWLLSRAVGLWGTWLSLPSPMFPYDRWCLLKPAKPDLWFATPNLDAFGPADLHALAIRAGQKFPTVPDLNNFPGLQQADGLGGYRPPVASLVPEHLWHMTRPTKRPLSWTMKLASHEVLTPQAAFKMVMATRQVLSDQIPNSSSAIVSPYSTISTLYNVDTLRAPSDEFNEVDAFHDY